MITSDEVVDTQSVIHRKDRFVISAIEIMDEFGIQKLSTREIARRQEVTEATLFKHFKSKNELLNAILDHFAKFDRDIFMSTQLRDLNPVDSILFLIGSLAEYYENYPAITSILQLYDVLRYERDLNEKVCDIFHSRAAFVKQLIEKAQKSGDIRADIDSECLADLLLGFFRETCLRWRIDGRHFTLKEKVLPAIRITLDAYRQNQKEGDDFDRPIFK